MQALWSLELATTTSFQDQRYTFQRLRVWDAGIEFGACGLAFGVGGLVGIGDLRFVDWALVELC